MDPLYHEPPGICDEAHLPKTSWSNCRSVRPALVIFNFNRLSKHERQKQWPKVGWSNTPEAIGAARAHRLFFTSNQVWRGRRGLWQRHTKSRWHGDYLQITSTTATSRCIRTSLSVPCGIGGRGNFIAEPRKETVQIKENWRWNKYRLFQSVSFVNRRGGNKRWGGTQITSNPLYSPHGSLDKSKEVYTSGGW